MPKTRKPVVMPDTEEVLKQMGDQIRLARLRRNISVNLICERAFISRTTLWKVENGDPGVAIGIYAVVLHAIDNMDKELLKIAKHDELPSITDVEENTDKVKLADGEYYKIEHSTDGDKNVLKATYKYNKLSLKDSLVYQNCFSKKSIVDGDHSIYIELSGDVTCEYFENATVTFKTDKQVLTTNATTKDEKNGTYSWDKITKDGIIIEVSKKNMKKDANLIPPVVRIVIVVILLGIGIYVLKRYNGVEE